METEFKLVTWNIEEECIYSRSFENENDAIQTAQALGNRIICPHDIIKIFRLKKTGHRWELAVWDIDKPQNLEYISFYSKKDAKFAAKVIKEYDETLKTELTKIY